MKEIIELNMVSELDKPKITILGGDSAEVAIGFKTKMDRADAQSMGVDLFHLAGKRLHIRFLEASQGDEGQLDMFADRFGNLDRARLIMALEEFEAVGRTIQRLACEATADINHYVIPIAAMEELLAEVEGALNMTGADQFKPTVFEVPNTICLYRLTGEGRGVEGKSFENYAEIIDEALDDGWLREHPDNVEGAQEPQEEEQEEEDEPLVGDAIYSKAVKEVRSTGEVSVSMIQRRFKIGYNRAARILEKMEEDGVVGSSRPGLGREVLPS